MNLKELKKEIPHKWRVQSFSKFKAQASCVAYIDARDVMDLLDEVVGQDKWQDDYKIIDGKLFAGIGININEHGGDNWIWKWDTGTESNIEKEKGQVSDSFKRAGVKWGIGRFLYDLKIQYVKANEIKTDKNFPYCIDDNGNRIWDLDKYIRDNKNTTQVPYKQETQKNISKPLMTEEQFKFAIKYLVDKKTIKIGTRQDIVMKYLEAQHEVPPKFMFLIEEEIAKASL